MLLYNTSRPQSLLTTAAIAGSVVLHGTLLSLALLELGPRGAATDGPAAIVVFADPAAPPVAMATETMPSLPTAPDDGKEAELPEPAVPEPSLADAVPLPPEFESLTPPDFAKAPPRPEPRKATPSPPPKADRRRESAVAPTPARRAPAPGAVSGDRQPGAVASSTAPGAASPGASAAVTAPALVPGWNALLAAWLAAHRRYPDESRRRGEEGDVTVRFTVAGNGQVMEVALLKSSGSTPLDAAALGMLRGATLPAPGTEATRTVRIRFRLSE